MTNPSNEQGGTVPNSAETSKGGQGDAPKRERPSLDRVIGMIASSFEKILSRGELAQLRRMNPFDPSCPAYWRVMALYVSSNGYVPSAEPIRVKIENQWAAILAAMAEAATVKGFHRPKRRVGHALADMGYKEARFLKLMNTKGDGLPDLLRLMAKYMASKAEACNWTELARLVLEQRGDRADLVRRRISRDYYSRLSQG